MVYTAEPVRHVRTSLDRVLHVAPVGICWALMLGVALTEPAGWRFERPPEGLIVAAAALGAGVLATLLPRVGDGLLTLLGRWGRRAELSVDGPALVVCASWMETRIPRAQIASGAVVRVGGRYDVELRLRDGRVLAFGFADRAAAEALLADLHLDATDHRATFDLGDPARRRLTLAIALANLGIAAATGPMFLHSSTGGAARMIRLGVGLAFLVWTLVKNVPTQVDVGLDCVELRALLRRRRIPLDAILCAEEKIEYSRKTGIAGPWRRDLVIRLRTGRQIRVKCGGESRFDQTVAAVVTRIHRALEARAALSDASTLEALARRDESVPAWRERVGRLLQAQGAYRTAPITPESLARIARNPDAPVEQRIGAALALGASRNRPLCREIRIAAGAVVDPRLRIALTEAVRDQPREEAVLEALEAELLEEAAAAEAD